MVFSRIHAQALQSARLARRHRARAALLDDTGRSLTVVGLYAAVLTSALAGGALALGASAVPLILAAWAVAEARRARRRARAQDRRVAQLLGERRAPVVRALRAHAPAPRMSPAAVK